MPQPTSQSYYTDCSISSSDEQPPRHCADGRPSSKYSIVWHPPLLLTVIPEPLDLKIPKPQTLALGDMAHWESGSKLTMKHYLHLKTLWVDRKATDFNLGDYVGEDVMNITRKYSKTSLLEKFFQGVLDTTPAKTQYSEKSIFSLVKFYIDLVRGLDSRTMQAEDSKSKVWVLRPTKQRLDRGQSSLGEGHDAVSASPSYRYKGKGNPTETLSSPLQFATPMPAGDEPAEREEFMETQDESIVNMHLVLLLNALTERVPEIRMTGCHWTPEHASFKINDNRDASRLNDPKKEKLLKALVDGHLVHTSGLSAALVEVKPYLRIAGRQNIQWQEAAQMCASICEMLRIGVADSGFGLLRSQNPEIKRRLMISQDHSEVYINIAEYDKAYERYLEGNTSPPPSRLQSNLISRLGSGAQSAPQPSRPFTNAAQAPLNVPPASPPPASAAKSPLKRIVKAMTPKPSKAERKKTKPKPDVSWMAMAPGPPRARDTAGFLVMRSYGPWTTTQPDDMGHLCHVLIALSLRLSRFVFEEGLSRKFAAVRI